MTQSCGTGQPGWYKATVNEPETITAAQSGIAGGGLAGRAPYSLSNGAELGSI